VVRVPTNHNRNVRIVHLYYSMAKEDYTGTRKSFMKIGEVYFWTATINNWQHLLREDQFKDIIIQSLDNLSERKLIDVFAFTIMPNHIHLSPSRGSCPHEPQSGCSYSSLILVHG
jgi:hypothetical protein